MILYWGLISAVLMSTTEARDGRELRAFQSTDLWTAGLVTDSCGDYEIDAGDACAGSAMSTTRSIPDRLSCRSKAELTGC